VTQQTHRERAYLDGYRDGVAEAQVELKGLAEETAKLRAEMRAQIQAHSTDTMRWIAKDLEQLRAANPAITVDAVIAALRQAADNFDRRRAIDAAVATERDPEAELN
jgi:hypothetical protein